MQRAELQHLALSARHLAELRALLERHVPDAEVWAFGSRVTPTACCSVQRAICARV